MAGFVPKGPLTAKESWVARDGPLTMSASDSSQGRRPRRHAPCGRRVGGAGPGQWGAAPVAARGAVAVPGAVYWRGVGARNVLGAPGGVAERCEHKGCGRGEVRGMGRMRELRHRVISALQVLLSVAAMQ